MGHRKGISHYMHGLSKTPEYVVWCGIKARCSNPKHSAYKNYGGRGINVCKRWENFGNFYIDMGPRPKGFCIERKDNNKDYSPDNCKWASRGEQALNTRQNKVLTFRGKTQCLKSWCDELKLPVKAISRRLHAYGFSVQEALTKPLRWRKYANS